MFQIDGPDTNVTEPTRTALGTVGYFIDEDLGAGTPGTVVTAEILNAVMKEMMYVVTHVGGVSLDKADDTQLGVALEHVKGIRAQNGAHSLDAQWLYVNLASNAQGAGSLTVGAPREVIAASTSIGAGNVSLLGDATLIAAAQVNAGDIIGAGTGLANAVIATTTDANAASDITIDGEASAVVACRSTAGNPISVSGDSSAAIASTDCTVAATASSVLACGSATINSGGNSNAQVASIGATIDSNVSRAAVIAAQNGSIATSGTQYAAIVAAEDGSISGASEHSAIIACSATTNGNAVISGATTGKAIIACDNEINVSSAGGFALGCDGGTDAASSIDINSGSNSGAISVSSTTTGPLTITGSNTVVIASDIGAGTVPVAVNDSLIGANSGGITWRLDSGIGSFWQKSHAGLAGSDVVRYTSTVQTTDATPTVMDSFSFSTVNRTVWLEAWVVARSTANEDAAYKIVGAAQNTAGTVTLFGPSTKLFTAEDTAAWNADWIVSGTSLALQVTGAAATTINWVATIQYQIVSA